MNPVPMVHLVSALVIAGVSVPMIRGRVKMNQWYGVRIRAAFESEAAWYDINRYGGRLLLVWSFIVAATATTGLLVEKKHWLTYNWTSLVIIVGGLAIVMGMIHHYAGQRRTR